jgi:mannose-6-phosphate isomerase-like protein (cupin superfamily)
MRPARAAGSGGAPTPTMPVRGPLPPGRTIFNPTSGELIVITETSAESGGQQLTFELFLGPGGKVPGGHIHPRQEETFSVLQGRMRFRLGLRVRYAGPGESVTVPSGTFHTFLNCGGGTAHVRVRSRPALRMEEVLGAAAELGRRRAGGLSRWRWAIEAISFLREFRAEVAAPLLPGWVVSAAARIAAGAPALRAERLP